MLIQEFIAQYPQAKENPLKFSVDSEMKQFHFDSGSEGERVTKSVLLQDFVEAVNSRVKEIEEYENTRI